MANVQAICTSFKKEILCGLHALGTSVVRAGTGADTIKGALILASKSLGAATAAYSAGDEITSSTGYTAGGATVTNATAPDSSGTTAFWTPSASLQWTGFTEANAFDAVLLYNDTAAGKNSIGLYTFGSQTITAGTFTLTMPTNDSSTGLIRIA